MSEKIYVDTNGDLIGVFGDGAKPPEGSIEVDEIPLPKLSYVKDQSLELIKTRHASVLKELSGNATTEERDTWPIQREWAQVYKSSQPDAEGEFLKGLLTVAEVTGIESQGGDAAMVMADKILVKASAMNLLTAKAGGLKREADQAIEAASSYEILEATMEALEVQMDTAIQEFKTALGM